MIKDSTFFINVGYTNYQVNLMSGETAKISYEELVKKLIKRDAMRLEEEEDSTFSQQN